ncbi:MAG: tRNA (guanine(46)-N(7))-methyltransferase TrmB [Candidatus Rhabdochlamydia sp.]
MPMPLHKLTYPFTWEDRRPCLHEGVLFIPRYYDHPTEWIFPSWEEIFNNSHPVHIEYCTGNGTWLAERARDPSVNWVAVEKRFDRVQKIWSKKQTKKLDNLLIVYGDAHLFIRHYLKEHQVEGVYVNFPDPWPKLKHAKNRLFQPEFVHHLGRVMKEGKMLTVVTDDEVYSHQVMKEMSENKLWTPSFPAPHYVTELEGYGSSFFEELWRQKGKQIRYMKFMYEGHLT